MRLSTFASLGACGVLLVACASSKRPPQSAAQDSSREEANRGTAGPAAYGQPAPGRTGDQDAVGKSDAAKATNDVAPPPPPSSPQGTQPNGGGFAQPPRALQISQAGTEVDTAQRELDVAAGDCRNACRALGSMDRAAGRLCSLAQSSEEARRCDDVKKKVYTARDKVKSTCGQCDGVSVDRNAPVPSK